MNVLLSAYQLSLSVAQRPLVQSLYLELLPGQMLALVGPNGAGKTTLLHALAGVSPVDFGRVFLKDRSYSELGARGAARERALLPQTQADAFSATALEVTLIGRHPHLGRWDAEGPDDIALARRALAQVGLAGFEDRDVQTLSGGERQRVAIATMLAQEAPVMLLDEPLNHLDVKHQCEVLELIRTCVQAPGADRAAILVMHDLQLAARFATHILLLDGKGGHTLGTPKEVLTEERLSEVYGDGIGRLERDGKLFFFPQ